MDKPIAGEVYEYKGHRYIIHDSSELVMKLPEIGWKDAVLYSREDRSMPLRFVRELTDFQDKFVKC